MDISQITDYLFVGRTPSLHDQHNLTKMGIRLIINMRFEARPHKDSLIDTLWLPSFDSPLMWVSVRILKKGVDAALGIIHDGGKIFVHCHRGIHRAVAMACCILIKQGYTPEDAMKLLKTRRPAADPYIWYIRRQIKAFSDKYGRNKTLRTRS